MAFIPVPNTYEIAVKQSIGADAHPVNVYHMTATTHVPLTQSIANSIAEGIEDGYESSGLNAHMSTTWTIDDILITELTASTSPQFHGVFDNINGTNSNDVLPTQTSLCIEWGTALRGRSFRGRTYHAGFCENDNNGVPSSGAQTTLASFASALGALANSLAFDLTVVSRFSGTHLVAGPGGQLLKRPLPRGVGLATPIVSSNVETVWNTQRRRTRVG